MITFNYTVSASPWNVGASKANYTAIRLAIQCTSAQTESGVAISPAIFAHLQRGDSDEFHHVCSAVDMIEMPVNTAIDGAEPQWLRKDFADLLFDCVEDANEGQEKIEEAIRFLAREIDSYRTLVGQTTRTISDGVN